MKFCFYMMAAFAFGLSIANFRHTIRLEDEVAELRKAQLTQTPIRLDWQPIKPADDGQILIRDPREPSGWKWLTPKKP